jgi:radical SAM protein with 4Fe4S-binding SPASM domain
MILRPSFSIQFHLTVRCESNCKHCYQFDSPTYESELKNELPLNKVKEILDDYEKALLRWDANGHIAFTGGDPLFREDLFDILSYASGLKRVKSLQILGNPYRITETVARRLFESGVRRYQISIDGMEKTHDYLRIPGSYGESIRALRVLKKAGVDTNIMFTLSQKNRDDLLDVIHLADEIGVNSFTFARLSSIGHGATLDKEMMSPGEYLDIYLSALKEYDKIMQKNQEIVFPKKDHLWVPLFWELGYLSEKEIKEKRIPKCGMGERHLTILSDGTTVACRRLPVPIAKLPEQKISEVFVQSEFLNRVRNFNNFEKCGKCKFTPICLGCPAVANGQFGSPFSPDPQCWVEV